MVVFPASGEDQFSENTQIWSILRSAIASSSGFKRWQLEHFAKEAQLQHLNLDQQVRRYLRETLETLAY